MSFLPSTWYITPPRKQSSTTPFLYLNLPPNATFQTNLRYYDKFKGNYFLFKYYAKFIDPNITIRTMFCKGAQQAIGVCPYRVEWLKMDIGNSSWLPLVWLGKRLRSRGILAIREDLWLFKNQFCIYSCWWIFKECEEYEALKIQLY